LSTVALICTLTFIVLTIALSKWQKLGLEKDIAIGTLRAALQLLAIGYVLQFVFQVEHPLLLAALILVMISVATWNAGQRGQGIQGIYWRVALTLTATEAIMMTFMIGLGIIEPTPQYVIPISGMTIGNAMIASGLFLNHMKREVETSRKEIEALLALGATERQAIQRSMQLAVKSSMIPTIDGMKTVGLVQLPGMMTGMIIAGADPVEAVRYQILIAFAFTASAAVTSIMLSILTYKRWFTKDAALRP